MARVVLARLCWDRAAMPRCPAGFYTLHVDPEPGHPFGRKGLQIASAWAQLSTPAAAGMVLLDSDVAIDPLDLAAMLTAIDGEPGSVHVGPVLLWPASTKLRSWTRGHGRGQFTADDPDEPDVWGFSFTYLPRALIERCVKAGLAGWRYPNVDRLTAAQARQHGVPARVVRDASPKHLNY